MNMNDYQKIAITTAVYPKDVALSYLALGLAGESGEVANKIKKILRGDWDERSPEEYELALEAIGQELGDILWYVAVLADELSVDLDSLALNNLAKLHDRQLNGTIKGSGDER